MIERRAIITPIERRARTAARPALQERIDNGGGNYFAGPKPNQEFFSSGSKILDLALGGGWAEQRVANVIGTTSTGKTLLMIEGSNNFLLKYRRGRVRYRETERAFDQDYAAALGMPIEQIDFGQPLYTVEDMFEDLAECAKQSDTDELYIVDSLDALSSRAELARDIDEASYGSEKAKQMSQLFRRLIQPMADKRVTLIIVSQVRDKIGVTYGRKVTRTGGRALDFYASQIVWLNQIRILPRTINGHERAYGVQIKAKTDKNKIGLAYRDAEFPILFGYGIDDAGSCIDWLKRDTAKERLLKEALGNMKEKAFLDMVTNHQGNWQDALRKLRQVVGKRWYDVEVAGLPKVRKYDGVTYEH